MQYVKSSSIHKTVGEKYPNDLQPPVIFRSGHHEALFHYLSFFFLSTYSESMWLWLIELVE